MALYELRTYMLRVGAMAEAVKPGSRCPGRAFGQPVSRFEDPRLLRGGVRNVDGMVMPRMVFSRVLRSPHAHARIRSRPRGSAVMLFLFAVEAQGLHYRRVAEAEQEGRAVASVDMLAEGPGRHRKHVLVFPVQPLAAYHRVAGTLDDVKVRAADAAAGLRLLTGTQ